MRRFGEPALHPSGPRGRGRREADATAWTPRQPCADRSGLVGRVLVHDDTNVRVSGNTGVDLLEEIEELPRRAALVPFADDEARCGVERGERRRRPAPDVVVRPPFAHARHHRQDRLLAVEGLPPTLLIDTERQRAVRRRQIKPRDVPRLAHERRAAGKLERLRPVRLQPERLPDPPRRRPRKPRLPGHRADRPMRSVRGGVSSARSTISLARTSSMLRRRPERGASDSPSTRSFGKRRRRLPTVRSRAPGSAATALLVEPSAPRRAMRRRSDIPRATRRWRTRRLLSPNRRSLSIMILTSDAGHQRRSIKNRNSRLRISSSRSHALVDFIPAITLRL